MKTDSPPTPHTSRTVAHCSHSPREKRLHWITNKNGSYIHRARSMCSHGSVFVILTNLLVLFMDTNVSYAPIHSENTVNCWFLFICVLVCVFVLPPNTCRYAPDSNNRLNKYIFVSCFSLCVNVLISFYLCHTTAHCFLLHTIVSIAYHIVLDENTPLNARTIMIIYLSGTLCSVYMFPPPFTMSSISILHTGTSPSYIHISFENAHMWASVLSSVSLNTAYFLVLLTEALSQ